MSLWMDKIGLMNLSMLPLVLLSLNSCAYAGKLDPKVPYPTPEAGYQRHVLTLPAQTEEHDLKLELQVGKTMQVDCNHHRFHATLIEHSVAGWGYPYYQVDKISGPTATLMACPQANKTSHFVAANHDSFMIRYNSKLPVVVIIPQGFELRYRIWQPTMPFKNLAPE